MAAMSNELLAALESDESGDLDEIIRRRRQEDFDPLLRLLSMDSSVKQEHRVKALYALRAMGKPCCGASHSPASPAPG